jgi:2-keto-4-pentenoate hydratase
MLSRKVATVQIDTGYLIPQCPAAQARRRPQVTVPAAEAATRFDPAAVAKAFVEARLAVTALGGFPGPLPPDMAAGYAVQDIAIGLWPDEVVGWKVGKIPEDLQAELGAQRVMGPVFARNVWPADPARPTPLPVIPGGFAAVEGEYVYRIGADAPADKLDWTPEEALGLAEAMLVGVEFAASPLATINVLGPRVVAADFGNNAGLVLGPAVPDWRAKPAPACEAFVADKLVGRGSPDSLPGGPASALAFLASETARRGRPLKRGQLVTTGAASGIHDIEAGQSARITFGELGEIRCVAVDARAPEGGGGTNHEHQRRNA